MQEDELIKRILNQELLSGQLEPAESERAEYHGQVLDYADRFINNIDRTRAYCDEAVDRDSIAMKSLKQSLGDLVDIFDREVASKGINAASGGHLGYIPGGGIYVSALADYLAAVTNEYAGLYFASPGAVTIETEMLNWLKSVFGFPSDSVGNLTSGGSVANMIALTAARDKYKIKANKVERSVVYMSPQAHHCIRKALRIIGLEDILIRYLELDERSRIVVGKLNDMIILDKSNGLNPFMVIASAGTTDTGAVDPLPDIGRIARANDMWFHIDGAYGGFFILTDERRDLMKGIETADSLVIDPHKSLFLPYGTGAVLVRDKEAVFHSHHYTASYMQDAGRDNSLISPSDVSPELTKHFRALRMWLPLQMYGLEPFIACLKEKLLLTEYIRIKLSESGFMTGPEPDLSITYFWYPSKTIDEDTYNQKLLELIHRDGGVFLSSTRINSKFVIRVAILSFRTKLRTIDRAIEIINIAKATLERDFNYT
jgi:glutamate/tyrosine decarboxylase-like PLP-dependent enzyme